MLEKIISFVKQQQFRPVDIQVPRSESQKTTKLNKVLVCLCVFQTRKPETRNFSQKKMHLKQCVAVVFAVLVATSTFADAKRSWSSSSSKTKSRPTSYSRPSSYGTSNHENTKLSYGSNYQSPPKPAAPASNPAPIGWNVPSNNRPAGPPPAYSASNPVGGAKTNPYEKPPAYNPAYSPSSGSNTNYRPSNTNTGTAAGAAAGAHHGTAYRPKQNSTGGFGGGYGHRNSTGGFGGIQPSYASNSHSSYPQQNLPAGATYHQNVPAGATYYPSGGYPAGGAGGYHPPAGASYYPAGGALPAGASYYPSGYHGGAGGGYPAAGGYHPPAGASYYPAGGALPAGATFYNSPSAVPAGAMFPQQSSGPGLGTGLIAGAIGGAILGHALTPTHTQVVQPQVAHAASSGDDKERIIIINNGQPPSVVETKDGTTIINTNPAAPAQPGVIAPQPGMQPAPAPGMQPAPAPAAPGSDIGMAPLAPMLPIPNTNGTDGSAPLAPFAAGTPNAAAPPVPAAQEQGPPPGGIICVPVMVNVTSPTDPNNVTLVEQIACYPAPPPEPQPQPAVNGTVPQTPEIPNQSSPPMEPEKVSTASLPENSKLQKSGAGSLSIMNLIPSAFMAFILAYCFQN